MKRQDMADINTISSDAIPAGVLNDAPVMEDFSISADDIPKLLQNLKPGKAAGPDRLKPLLLKELREEVAPFIQVIFKRSIKIGKLPADWCNAQVTPIFKKVDKSSAANYLTCILCKALEHYLASHLVEHVDNYELLFCSTGHLL